MFVIFGAIKMIDDIFLQLSPGQSSPAHLIVTKIYPSLVVFNIISSVPDETFGSRYQKLQDTFKLLQ